MPRPKKPEPLDTYRHEKTRVEVKIFLNRDTYEYFAEYAGKRISNKDHGALVKELREAIEAYHTLILEPVIHITVQTRGRDPFLAFTYDRFLVCNRHSKSGAKLKGGDMLKCQWHIERSQRKTKEEIEALKKKLGRDTVFTEENDSVPYEGMNIPDAFKLQSATEWNWDVDRSGPFHMPCRPTSWRGFEDEIYISYDERTWTALTIFHERLLGLAKTVKHHFLDAEKLALLTSTGVALLGLPCGAPSSESPDKDDDA